MKIRLDKEDRVLSFSIFLFFFIQSVNGSLKLLIDISDNFHSLASNLFGIVYIVYFFVKALPIVYKRSSKVLIKSYFIFTVLYITSILMALYRIESTDWLISQNAVWTFAFWIPVGISAYSIIEYKTLYDVLLKHSYILSVIFTAVFVKSVIFMSGEQANYYNMFFSYLLVIPTVLHLSFYLSSKNKLVLLLFLFEFIMIVIVGARGPIISVALFLIIKFIISTKSLFSKLYISIISTVVFIFIYSNLGYINTFIVDNYNIRSRTLQRFAESDINTSPHLSGRDIAWKGALTLIEDKPFFGYGIAGTLHLMEETTGTLSHTGDTIGTPHNGLLELMLYFGVPIGLFLSLLLILSVLNLRKSLPFYFQELLIFTFAVFLTPSITIGGGVLTKPGVAIYIYIILRIYSKKSTYSYE